MDDGTQSEASVKQALLNAYRGVLKDAYPDWMDGLAGPEGNVVMEALAKTPSERTPSETAIVYFVGLLPGGEKLVRSVNRLWGRIKEIE